MSEPHAVIALAQFRRLDEFIAHRRRIADRYNAALSTDGPVTPLIVPEGARCNYYKYVAFLPDGVDRAALKQLLREEYEVSLSGEEYDTPLHRQPVFAPWTNGPLPGAERICDRHVCLPVSAVITEEQAEYVVDSLRAALQRTAISNK